MLLLDEPTNHIDLDGLDMIDAIMGSFQGTGEKADSPCSRCLHAANYPRTVRR